jgi:hypothetical protein
VGHQLHVAVDAALVGAVQLFKVSTLHVGFWTTEEAMLFPAIPQDQARFARDLLRRHEIEKPLESLDAGDIRIGVVHVEREHGLGRSQSWTHHRPPARRRDGRSLPQEPAPRHALL